MRNTTGTVIQIHLGVVIAAFVAAALYTYWMIDRREDALDHISRNNVAFSASQAAIEFQRFEKALLQLERNRTAANLAEAKLRFEILSNRASILNQGEFAEFTRTVPTQKEVVAKVQAASRILDRVVADAEIDLKVEPVLAVLEPIEPWLVGLTAEANRYGADRITHGRLDLLALHRRFSTLSFGLILSGLCLVGALTWHNRMLARAHRRLGATTESLKQSADDLVTANSAVAFVNEELKRQNALLREKEDALREQNVLFDAALNNMSQGLCMFDGELRPIVTNTMFEQLFDIGARPGNGAAGVSLRELMPDIAAELERNIAENRDASFETDCRNGRIIAVAQQPMPDGRWVATFADVTEQRRAQARIAHMARHDGLTNLPNRYAFRERMQEAIREAAASDAMLAVMCLDVDNFKEVNDTLGHPSGDALLCAAAERLARTVRESDMVARFGGDEFAILQPRIGRFDDAERLAVRLIEEMRKPFAINGELIYATASLGVAISPKHGSDPDILQKNADLALYAAKADGKRTYRFFESAMDERLTHRHAMERDLRQALAADEFELHYQPIINLRSGRMTGLEALIRWRHPAHGLVPPGKFIPVAEDAGLIGEIGRWVLMQACADASRWPAHLKISVNLSAAQFVQGDIVEDIRSALSRAGLRPERLVVEITESLLLTDNADTLDMLHRLKALRIDIAMDDFGTGYSSLSYLRKYSFDRIKIDRNFVSSAGVNDKNPGIIKAIVQLGASLGMTTVAEGVETAADLDMVRAAGCAEGQGYLFGRPAPAGQTLEMIAAEMQAAVPQISRVA